MLPNPSNFATGETCGVRVVHLDRVSRAQKDVPDEDRLERMAGTFKVLGDPTRLRIVMALRAGEMCVCDLAAFAGTSESAVSHQLRRLRDMALVRRRRDGQILYYSLDDAHVVQLLGVAEAHLHD